MYEVTNQLGITSSLRPSLNIPCQYIPHSKRMVYICHRTQLERLSPYSQKWRCPFQQSLSLTLKAERCGWSFTSIAHGYDALCSDIKDSIRKIRWTWVWKHIRSKDVWKPCFYSFMQLLSGSVCMHSPSVEGLLRYRWNLHSFLRNACTIWMMVFETWPEIDEILLDVRKLWKIWSSSSSTQLAIFSAPTKLFSDCQG